tara:strand:+ start:30 stop:323 length:294 start_codon:yes stop_codon:yes gene_type:complete
LEPTTLRSPECHATTLKTAPGRRKSTGDWHFETDLDVLDLTPFAAGGLDKIEPNLEMRCRRKNISRRFCYGVVQVCVLRKAVTAINTTHEWLTLRLV